MCYLINSELHTFCQSALFPEDGHMYDLYVWYKGYRYEHDDERRFAVSTILALSFTGNNSTNSSHNKDKIFTYDLVQMLAK